MRLKRHFDYLFNGGFRVDSHAFRIHFRKPYMDRPAVAFVATKRQGSAVKRNRSKRRLREIYRYSQLSPQIDADMVVISKQPVLTWAFPALAADFDRLLHRIVSAPEFKQRSPEC